MADNDDTKGSGFLAGFLFGAVAGVAVAILATPKTGEETREVLLARARDAAEKARAAATVAGESVTESASELLARGRTMVDEARARIDDAMVEGKDAADRQRTDLTEPA